MGVISNGKFESVLVPGTGFQNFDTYKDNVLSNKK